VDVEFAVVNIVKLSFTIMVIINFKNLQTVLTNNIPFVMKHAWNEIVNEKCFLDGLYFYTVK